MILTTLVGTYAIVAAGQTPPVQTSAPTLPTVSSAQKANAAKQQLKLSNVTKANLPTLVLTVPRPYVKDQGGLTFLNFDEVKPMWGFAYGSRDSSANPLITAYISKAKPGKPVVATFYFKVFAGTKVYTEIGGNPKATFDCEAGDRAVSYAFLPTEQPYGVRFYWNTGRLSFYKVEFDVFE